MDAFLFFSSRRKQSKKYCWREYQSSLQWNVCRGTEICSRIHKYNLELKIEQDASDWSWKCFSTEIYFSWRNSLVIHPHLGIRRPRSEIWGKLWRPFTEIRRNCGDVTLIGVDFVHCLLFPKRLSPTESACKPGVFDLDLRGFCILRNP